MKFILIMTLLAGYGNTSVTAEFNSKQACEEALVEYNDMLIREGYKIKVLGKCVSKGENQ